MAQDFSLQFKRQYADAIDADFRMTTEERQAYLSNPLRYAGMPVFDTTEDKPYYLSNTLDAWVPFGFAVDGTPFAGAYPIYDSTKQKTVWGIEGNENGYDVVYFVDVSKGEDSTAKAGSTSHPYKSIKQAALDAYSNYTATGNRNLVYVTRGVYYEWNINQDNVDMFFEEYAIVISQGTGSGCILTNDHLPAGTTCRVYGKGEFYANPSNSNAGKDAINFGTAKYVYVEGKGCDMVHLWGSSEFHAEFRNMTILYGVTHYRNQNVKYYNCTFPTGIQDGVYLNQSNVIEYYDCEFIVQDITGSFRDIFDHTGTKIASITAAGATQFAPSAYTLDQRANFIDTSPHTNDYSAAISYIEPQVSSWGNVNHNLKYRFFDPVIRVRISNGVGIRCIINYDNDMMEFLVRNPTIIDETPDKQSIALVQGKKAAVNTILDFSVSNLHSNCTRLSHIPTNYVSLKETYKDLIGLGLSVGDTNVQVLAVDNITGELKVVTGATPSVHTHAISGVTGLQTALDGKSGTGHTHSDMVKSVNGTLPDASGNVNIAASSGFEGLNYTPALNSLNMTGATSTGTNAFSIAKGQATGNHSLAGGWNSVASGLESFAFGEGNVAGGYTSVAFGYATTASGEGAAAFGGFTNSLADYTHAQNFITNAEGVGSHAGGLGLNLPPDLYPIKAAGRASFNHSEVTVTGTTGAWANNSAILGGLDHNITSGATRSAIIGGVGITATAPDTVYVPNLVVKGTITDASGNTIGGGTSEHTHAEYVKSVNGTLPDANGNVTISVSGGTAPSVDWSSITNKPSTFTPSAHNHSATNITSGTLAVARGGTGLSTVTAGNFIVGNGTAAMQQKTPAEVLTLIGGVKTVNGVAPDTTGNVSVSVSGSTIDAYTKLESDDKYAAKTHGHLNATTSVNGFMSAADKTKLDGIGAADENATANTLAKRTADGSLNVVNLFASGNVQSMSDARLKDNVVSYVGSLSKIEAMHPVSYTRNDLEGKLEVGFIAQEMKVIEPLLTGYNEAIDTHTVDYARITVLLVGAVQELAAEVKRLKGE